MRNPKLRWGISFLNLEIKTRKPSEMGEKQGSKISVRLTAIAILAVAGGTVGGIRSTIEARWVGKTSRWTGTSVGVVVCAKHGDTRAVLGTTKGDHVFAKTY